jgi:hypothetical protein
MKKTDISTEQTVNDGSAANEPLVPVDPSSLTQEQFDELRERAAKAEDHWELQKTSHPRKTGRDQVRQRRHPRKAGARAG